MWSEFAFLCYRGQLGVERLLSIFCHLACEGHISFVPHEMNGDDALDVMSISFVPSEIDGNNVLDIMSISLIPPEMDENIPYPS